MKKPYKCHALALILVLIALFGSAAGGAMVSEPIANRAKRTGPCIANATRLCVAANRFEVTANWKTPDGHTGAGQAVSLTADTGYFWFFSDSNVEVVLKVLDACRVNHRFWVFAGGLTNVQVDLFVRDTTTGIVKTYHNPQSAAFRPIQDAAAFNGCANAVITESEAIGVPTGTILSVGQNRFQVTANWRTPEGQTGSGQAVQLTDETGYFWFFAPSNVELVLKVLDGCVNNNYFWVFAGGLTNVQVDVTVTDTATGVVKVYHNPQESPFQPVQDTSVVGQTDVSLTRACRARVTFSRMSPAVFVQMKGLGSSL
jgi:hypothetical protein